MRLIAALLLASVALIALRSDSPAQANELLYLATDIHYDVRGEEGDVLVTWDVSLTNNDPETTFSNNGTVFFYDGLSLPVLTGATQLSAQSAAGTPLSTSLEGEPAELLERADITFDRQLFFGDSYSFQLSYVVPEARDVSLLVTPSYVFLPLVTLGDDANVSVSAPQGPEWETSLEAAECEPGDGTALVCGGSEDVYVAGLLEVLQPDAMKSVQFEVPMDEETSAVTLTYFEGEDELAAHQREVIEAALPLLEDVYGIPVSSSGDQLTVAHGGRQSVFGYEGVTNCSITCEIIISPVAGDHVLVHELAHLWSDIFDERWLYEGFAEWARLEVTDRLPEGLLNGPGERFTAGTSLQLDEWENPESLIGADEDYVETTTAGYALSLRFIQTLADEVGADGLREINSEIRRGYGGADSEDYMDHLEDVTGINPDELFRVWVFPASYDERIEMRREARNRYAEMEGFLQSEGLPQVALGSVWTSIQLWQFDSALDELDAIQLDVDRYFSLQDELQGLESDADLLGLAVPEEIGAAIMRWEFEAAEKLLASARSALGSYGLARERLAEPRNLWQRFGLIGDDPEEELERAQSAFESGAYDRSLDRSHSAVEMVDDAGSMAMRRLLIVAGIFGAVAGAIGVAYWIALLRQRRLAEP